MDFLDFLIAKIAPHNCLECGIDGRLMCAACVDKLPVVPQRCYRCYAPSPGWLTCAGCFRASGLRSVRAATIYADGAKALIWKLKLAGARAAARIMAERLAPLLKPEPGTIVVPVPTATGRARRRGYDQAKLLARELSRLTRLPYRDCLARHGQTHQHGLHSGQRLAQLSAAFRVKRPGLIQETDIVLVDDVTTTGATLEAAAAVLKKAGANGIQAAVFASTEKSSG